MSRRMSESVKGFGLRLKQIRESLKLSPWEMSKRLGIEVTTYYKNENQTSYPCYQSLKVLHNDFGISMDWFFFNRGPMYFKEKETITTVSPLQALISELETTVPDIKEMLESMLRDGVFRHETMLNYFKYKNKPEPSTSS